MGGAVRQGAASTLNEKMVSISVFGATSEHERKCWSRRAASSVAVPKDGKASQEELVARFWVFTVSLFMRALFL